MLVLFILICLIIVGLWLGIKGKLDEQREIVVKEKFLEEQREKDLKISKYENEISKIPEATPTPIIIESNNVDYKISNITKSTNYEKLADFVVIDIETTGLSARSNEIIEIAAIKYNNFKPTEKISMLVKPKKEIPWSISQMTKITNELVANEKSINEVIPFFQGFIEDYNLVGHNIEFDIEFLVKNGLVLSKKQKLYDNLALSRKLLKKKREKYDKSLDFTFTEGDVANYKLETLCDFYKIYRGDSHRALSDCYATGLIYTTQIKKFLESSK